MLADIERTDCAESLGSFVKSAWEHVESDDLVWNWHLDELANHFQAVSELRIRRLLINIPPSTGKSRIQNVFWPAWEWITRPQTKFIYASFDERLVGQRDGTACIDLLNSDWYLDLWGERLKTPKKNSASNFLTTGGGFRFSTSPGGKGTGRHGHVVVVDDPNKPADVMGPLGETRKAIGKVSIWWSGTMSTRRADPSTHREVITQQRLAEGDLSGEMLAKGGWEHLRLPMRYEADYPCRTVAGGDHRATEGELLFPQRFPALAVEAIESGMTEGVIASQHQQRPTAVGGTIFRRVWWQFWGNPGENQPCVCERCFQAGILRVKGYVPCKTGIPCPVLPESGQDCQSWDLTFKGAHTSDFVAGQVWRAYQGKYYLRDRINERLDFAATATEFQRWEILWPETLEYRLVEDAANGPAILAQLGGCLMRPTLGGLEARAYACQPAHKCGKVYLPHPDRHPWVWEYMRQHERYPRDMHDDEVAAMSHAIVFLQSEDRSELWDAMRNVKEGRV